MLMTKNYQYCYDGNRVVDIPYYEAVEMINEIGFRKHIIIDIRRFDSSAIFKDFPAFNKSFFQDDFFTERTDVTHPLNFMLYFLYDKNQKYDINKHDILYNFDYTFKHFITEEDLPFILSKNKNTSLEEKTTTIHYQNRDIQINNFNLIYGLNGSGKSLLLNYLSQFLQAPMFSAWIALEDGHKILTSSQDVLDNFNNIIDYCQGENIPLLMDDLGWGRFDDRNSIKMVDALFDYSIQQPVFITSPKENIKQLVKSRTFNPNIIDLDKTTQ